MKKFCFILFILTNGYIAYSQVNITDTTFNTAYDFMEELSVLDARIIRECECYDTDSSHTNVLEDINYCFVYLSEIKSHSKKSEYEIDTVRMRISTINRVSKNEFKRTDFSLKGELIDSYTLMVNYQKSYEKTKIFTNPSGEFSEVITKYYKTYQYPKK